MPRTRMDGPADLQSFREEARAAQGRYRARVLISTSGCHPQAGTRSGGAELGEAFRAKVAAAGLEDEVAVVDAGWLGLCYGDPVVCIAQPDRPTICYGRVTPDLAAELVDAHLVRNTPLPTHALGTVGPGAAPGIPALSESPLFKPQIRRTLRHCGFVDPTSIDDYLAVGGYSGFARALEIGPDGSIDELRRSGLRGRGGAGFPVWRKWKFTREAVSARKYVICNGSEGDPGTFSNKVLLESDPHSVLEGLLIAAHASGAQEGYVYCPTEYPRAIRRLQAAVEQMEERGLLGEHILGSSFDFHLHVKQGAGAYLCGEETALIECIEGKRGVPRMRPPFPPVSGLFSAPTIVNNVETLACVTFILQDGAFRFAELGTERSKGTKLFCLSGNVKHAGVIEVPFGVTLRQIVFDIGGGPSDGSRIKAIQTGGPAGGCLPPETWGLPVDQDSLLALGASTGSGGVIVMDEGTCMVDIARHFLEFAEAESCGKCVPCRVGTRHMLDTLRRICAGRGRMEDLDALEQLGRHIRSVAVCGLGQTSSNPMLSTLKYFRDEYEEHIRSRRCRASVCEALAPAENGPVKGPIGQSY